MNGFNSKQTIDNVSWRILCALQENARLSYSELGRCVGLSPPAVAERVRRLEEAGIIAGYRAQIDLEKVGLPLTAYLRLSVPGRPSTDLPQVLRELPEVLECHHVTGVDCYVIKVAVSSVLQLEKLIEQLVQYGQSTTSIVLSSPVTHKVIGPPQSEPLALPRVARRS
jgi:Lrp/AsnC family leucine-responsive transcriptional regulator